MTLHIAKAPRTIVRFFSLLLKAQGAELVFGAPLRCQRVTQSFGVGCQGGGGLDAGGQRGGDDGQRHQHLDQRHAGGHAARRPVRRPVSVSFGGQ